MLEHGRVVEQGSHEQLLAADGRYAALFKLQAERFAQEEEETEALDDADLRAEDELERGGSADDGGNGTAGGPAVAALEAEAAR